MPAGHSHKATAKAEAGPPTVFATGLENPRGLAFGPDGNLYVAEAGTGGTQTTVGTCTQVEAPVGPYMAGLTSRISKIAPDGTRTTVADGLPSSTDQLGGTLGAADVLFLDGQLYTLISGGGCSHGFTDHPNAILRVNADGSTTQIADLSAFLLANPVDNPPADFDPDGTWYSFTTLNGAFYAVDPNQGDIERVALDGTITRVFDFSTKLGHVVPTAIDASAGRLFLGNLGTFPVVPGSEFVRKLTAGGKLSKVAGGLTTVLGVVVDKHGRIYALESMTAPGFPSPDQIGTGMVVRVKRDGSTVPIATGLSFATGIALGPDHALYVSNFGFGAPPGSGQIMRIPLT